MSTLLYWYSLLLFLAGGGTLASFNDEENESRVELIIVKKDGYTFVVLYSVPYFSLILIHDEMAHIVVFF